VAAESLSEYWNVTGENSTTKCGRLNRGEAEAFVQRHANEERAFAVEPFQLGFADFVDDAKGARSDRGAELVIQAGDPA
jgi:hypothetical protein